MLLKIEIGSSLPEPGEYLKAVSHGGSPEIAMVVTRTIRARHPGRPSKAVNGHVGAA
jgi:hypothetical protein